MRKIICITYILLAAQWVVGQQNGTEDALAKLVYSPDLVMQNQANLELSEAQRERLINEIKQAQTDFMDLSWEMSDAEAKFVAALDHSRVDENDVINTLSAMLAIETETKKRQLRLLVRIKNILSPKQQEMLEKLK